MQAEITSTKHIPVLATEVMQQLDPKPNDHYLDLTAGYGGHAQLVSAKAGATGNLTLVDRDEQAVEHLKQIFKGKSNVRIMHSDFLSASRELLKENKKFDVILADLGVSSPHLNIAERGFSFSSEGPLDMRMDQRQSKTAADIINHASEAELVGILKKYGEIKHSAKLARILAAGRPYKSTRDLAGRVAEAIPRRKKRTHPATEVFQALRIAVNSELELLEQSLPLWFELLAHKGRIGVISFHSLEDRLVKQAFRDYGGNRYDARLHIVTKRPIVGSDKEIVFNPRARSAKLRVAQRK
ncbi:16S rRNA (cytosine(1402)-N(4))-methyltransferase RsmH [Candidatus Parcubacteria bacterium]|nr:16S rRNA (cytosine(1402)-N(4))-methyltransferase RsmH [Candidatus Parcubacteria bacterium]